MILFMKSFTDTLRGEIKAELTRKSIGQKVLAEAWGITQSACSYKLSGRTGITTDQLDVAAKVLGYASAFDLVESASWAAKRAA